MPLVSKPSGIEPERITRIDTLGYRQVSRCRKARATIGSCKHMIDVESRLTGRGPGRVRPLLRSIGIQPDMRQRGDVEIAPTGGADMLAKNVCR